MLFRKFLNIILVILGVILVLQGIDLIFHLGYQLYLSCAFWFVFVFELGVCFCKHKITYEVEDDET